MISRTVVFHCEIETGIRAPVGMRVHCFCLAVKIRAERKRAARIGYDRFCKVDIGIVFIEKTADRHHVPILQREIGTVHPSVKLEIIISFRHFDNRTRTRVCHRKRFAATGDFYVIRRIRFIFYRPIGIKRRIPKGNRGKIKSVCRTRIRICIHLPCLVYCPCNYRRFILRNAHDLQLCVLKRNRCVVCSIIKVAVEGINIPYLPTVIVFTDRPSLNKIFCLGEFYKRFRPRIANISRYAVTGKRDRACACRRITKRPTIIVRRVVCRRIKINTACSRRRMRRNVACRNRYARCRACRNIRLTACGKYGRVNRSAAANA